MPRTGPDELPAIEHHGAFWELRHGALRIELTWHRADHVKAQGRRARASSRRAGAEGGPDDARWHQSQRYSSSPPERRGSPPLGRSLPASALSSDSAAAVARALPPPPTRSNSSSAAANVGPDGWRAEPPPSPAPPASPPPPHSSPSRPAGAVSPPSVSDRVGEAADEGDLARRSHREDGRTAKAWVVMEKAFAQLPESSDLRRRRRAHRLVRVPSDEGVAEASCSSAPEVSASAASRGDARGSTRGGAAGDAVGGAGGGARRGGERRITRSVTGEPVGLSFCEDLYLNGKVVGVCEGQMQLLEQPSVVQQAYGTLTEAGTQFAAPVVLGSSAGRRRRVGVAGSLLEARRLAALCDGLSRALARDDVLVRERVVAELSDLLAVSHKRGGHASFVFDSSADLAACRETMFDLWELLLRSLEAGALRFDARTQAYDLLVQLLRRAEISTTMQDEGGRAGGRLSSRRGAAVPTHQLLLWLELSQRTLSHVLVAFDDLASVEHSDHLLGVCARLMAMSYFRLPAFASALIETLHAEDVLAASQPAAIPEFRGIAFSLDCAGELAALQERGFSTHPPLDWRHIHRSAEAAAAHALARGGMPRPTGEAPWAFGARTKYRAPSQRDAALAAQAAAQRGAASHLAGVLRLPAWRERLGRRGHLFCLFFTEWLDVVIDSLGPTVPPHFFAWPRLPGFTTLLTCTLLEMSARPPPLLAEPLVQLSNQLLRCTHLHSVLVKIVFHRCSVHDVRAVSTTLNLMNSWMTALLHRLQEDRMRPADAAPLSQPLLRSTFDFAFFFRGMAVLFDSEHVQVLLKACEFLYRHFDLLPDHQADKMRTTMLRGCLTRLQLHWSAEVRSFFAHLLVLRLEQPCAWAVPRLPSEPAPAPVEPAIVRQFEAAAARLASLAVQALPAERAQERREQRGRPEQPDEGRQLQQLQPYAAAALALYEQLTAVRRDMQRDLSLWSRGASSAAPPSLPTLKCDTSVLDLEEDRVIWVRESELGKGIVFE